MINKKDALLFSFLITLALIINLAGMCTAGCQKKHERVEPTDTERLQAVCNVYNDAKKEVYSLIKNHKKHWPAPHDCDGMIWAGKLAAVLQDGYIDIESAQDTDNVGMWHRRPDPWCWNPVEGDVGSKTTWSRDMAKAGLYPWILLTEQEEHIKNHVKYGEEHYWKMGEPLDDGRVLYTPEMIGITYKILDELTGSKSLGAKWPTLYTKGLTDYHAHLQIMGIWIRGELASRNNNSDAIPNKPTGNLSLAEDGDFRVKEDGSFELLSIGETMYLRLKEHTEREPRNPLYAVVWAMYSGEYSRAIDIVLDPAQPVGEYVRCPDNQRECQLSEWLFSTFLLLKSHNFHQKCER